MSGTPPTVLSYCLRTMRFKVKAEAYPWFEAGAVEVNQVWNWANATSYKAARPFVGSPKWLTGYDLDKLSAGAAKCFEHIGSETIQRINAEYAAKRRQAKRAKLRWRVSRGSKRSLGWIPFKGAQLKRQGKSLRFAGKTFRVFESERLMGIQWQSGTFAQDSVGDWWLSVSVKLPLAQVVASQQDVGIDLGLKETAATSDGLKLRAGHFYRDSEQRIACAQRRGHRRQAKRLHRQAARRRLDAQHKFSRKMVDTYQMITVGDVSSLKLVKTRMAKSVLDSGWGALKTQLQYKGQQAGRVVQLVSERNSTRACSNCGALTGPSGAQHQHRSRSCPPADRGAPECRERDARFQGIELRTYARQRQQYADRGSE